MCNILGNHLRLELLHTSLPLIPGLHQGLGTPTSRLAWRNWSRGPNLAPGHPQALARIDAQVAWHHFEPCPSCFKAKYLYNIYKKIKDLNIVAQLAKLGKDLRWMVAGGEGDLQPTSWSPSLSL